MRCMPFATLCLAGCAGGSGTGAGRGELTTAAGCARRSRAEAAHAIANSAESARTTTGSSAEREYILPFASAYPRCATRARLTYGRLF